MNRIRIIKHEVIPKRGSFEVKFHDGRASAYFYWDDLISRRLRPEHVDQETAKKRAQELARAEMAKLVK